MAHYSRLSKIVIDAPPADHDRELARLEKLGAERAWQAHSWRLMRDPAGRAFCVIPERPGELNDSNARRWD